jgi:hypothetical protein
MISPPLGALWQRVLAGLHIGGSQVAGPREGNASWGGGLLLWWGSIVSCKRGLHLQCCHKGCKSCGWELLHQLCSQILALRMGEVEESSWA